MKFQVHFKGTNTIKALIMAPKDRDSKLQKSGVIYKFECAHINCPGEYIGESSRTFRDRLKEHHRAPSPIHHHNSSTGLLVSPECFTSVDRESWGSLGTLKRLCIHVNDSSLNKNLGKYQLRHKWEQVLQDTPAIQLK